MNTDGNTDAINRHLDEREKHDAWQEGRDAIEALADAEDRIEELTAQLAKVTAELADAEANINIKADWIEATIDDMAAQHDAIPRAYQMGLEAAAAKVDYESIGMTDDGMDACEHVAFEIRALTPPADLAEQCKKGTSHE